MKAKILIDDPSGRFKYGDVGNLSDNDFEKYEYKIEFSDGRSYYFYEQEIELLRDKPTGGNEWQQSVNTKKMIS